ncbi:MAG: protein-glutamate O-methyltransferase CheR [Bacteriovoracaceae bacterium]|nr:protein-glutamate O-methyltransferase CheR [Bacteriovoracaceae bacterium]
MKSKDTVTTFEAPKTSVIQDSNISDEQFDFLSKLIFEKVGIYLDHNKTTMVQSRILRRLKKLDLDSIKDYITYLKENPDKEMDFFINSLTTNKTDFFRENDHFEYLKDVFLKDLIEKKTGTSVQDLYIWSAACSAGHEVYTLALVMDEFCKKNPRFNYKILGSDIDTDILDRAKKAVYPAEQIDPIPRHYLQGNFQKGSGENEGFYRASDHLKRNVKFKRFNLTVPTERVPLTFDIIFLRNVLIYFPPEIIKKVIDKLASHLKSGGLLIIGHSETLNGIEHDLEFLGSSIYKKK